jgi:ABC-type transporter Mla subunit MlaD
MISRRIVANLIAFGLLAAALVAYGFFDLLGDPLASGTTVSTILPSAAGLSPNFLVTLDGVDVGTVKSVSLVPNGAKVTMALDPGTNVPSDVQARVVVANALGEQEVDLVPSSGSLASYPSGDPVGATASGRYQALSSASSLGHPQTLRNGALIPAAPDSTPADVGTVVDEATNLLKAIPEGSLNELLHEAAVALNGNAGNLKTIASASALFSQEFLAQQQAFESLLSNAPPVLDTVNANAAALQQGLADTAVLQEVLATHASDLVRLLSRGSDAATALETVLSENQPNLACFVHDSADLAANLGSPANLHNLSTALSTNQLFFGAVQRLAVTGPAKALSSSDSSRSNQEWLRTRLLFPGLDIPVQPQPIVYPTPTKLPAVLPGAGCSTEFGQGVGPVTQQGFHPYGPDARLLPPSSTDSTVRGGGQEPTSSAPAAVRLSSGGTSFAVPVALGLVALGWTIAMGRRRGARSALPVRSEISKSTRRKR